MVLTRDFMKALTITVCFVAVAVTGAFFHEPWRDEIQAWLIATHAHSLTELYANCRYEGHPMLWHMLLYVLSQCTHDIVAMQLLSVCVTGISVFLLCWFSPLSWLQKTLFAFGFYPLFQYCILSRSYGLVLLFMIGYLCVAPQSILGWMLLACMANTSATGFVLASCFACALLVKEWNSGIAFTTNVNKHKWGILLSAWQIYPEPDNNYSAGFSIARLKMVFSQLHDSYAYIAYWPDLLSWSTVYMRNMHYFDLVLSIALFLLFAGLFAQHKHILIFYISGTFCMVLLLAITNMFSARFIGHFYLILIASYWLLFQEQKIKYRQPLQLILTLVLGCQLVTSCGLLYADYTHSFSNGKKVAQYINEKQLRHYPVTGAADYTLSPLSYWLGKPLYYMESRAFGSFIVWNNARNQGLSPAVLLQQTDSLATCYEKVLVVLSTELPTMNRSFKGFMRDSIASEHTQWQLLQKMEGALVSDENYYLYLASPKR
jgi:hypothetical protein